MSRTDEKQFVVSGGGFEWEGPLEELLAQNPEFPQLVARRLEELAVGETIRPPVGEDIFTITRKE